jgi:hypothetical protein
MSEYDSPNFAEFSYTRKSEGRYKVKRCVLIACYALFVGVFFGVVLMTKLIPVFALCPIFLWMLIFFTWRYVSYDFYFEFKEGNLELGKIMGTKNGRKKYPQKKIHIKEALFIAPYADEESKIKIIEAKKIYDFSASNISDKRILIIYKEGCDTVAAIFEGTAKMAKLCASFCQNSQNIKGQIFHG